MGGIMVGEHIDHDEFRVVDITYQKRGGTIAHFVRDPAHHKAFLAGFFERTGNAYERFNYIGEWHSHPAFEPLPSGEDFRTMYDLVEDPKVGVNFAVLIVARLRGWSTVELSATLFRPGHLPEAVDVAVERDHDTLVNSGALSRFLDKLW
jgi:hypothetical protein